MTSSRGKGLGGGGGTRKQVGLDRAFFSPVDWERWGGRRLRPQPWPGPPGPAGSCLRDACSQKSLESRVMHISTVLIKLNQVNEAVILRAGFPLMNFLGERSSSHNLRQGRALRRGGVGVQATGGRGAGGTLSRGGQQPLGRAGDPCGPRGKRGRGLGEGRRAHRNGGQTGVGARPGCPGPNCPVVLLSPAPRWPRD